MTDRHDAEFIEQRGVGAVGGRPRRVEQEDLREIGTMILGRTIVSVDYPSDDEPGSYLVITLDAPGKPRPTLYVDAPTLYTTPEATT